MEVEYLSYLCALIDFNGEHLENRVHSRDEFARGGGSLAEVLTKSDRVIPGRVLRLVLHAKGLNNGYDTTESW